MPQNFIECDREQAFLMPPSLRDWLPADHLAWFVLETVDRLDLEAFYAAYRPDGHGRAAYEPSMVVALLMYAYSTKVYSSRDIERHCRQDIAYRVITANRVPDHATVARFVRRHEQPLAGLFGSVLRLCASAGLVRSGVVAVDGTKLTASASSDSNVAGFPRPRASRLWAANRPNSISRVFSAFSSSWNFASLSLRSA